MNLDFVQNPWFSLSGWIIGAISLAAAFYYGVKGKAKKELSYLFVKSERLISMEKRKFQNYIYFLEIKKSMI